MIKVERGEGRPSALDRVYPKGVKPPKVPGKSERDAVIQRIEEYRQAQEKHRQAVARAKAAGKPAPELKEFKFPYGRYSESEVIEKLAGLFHKKCAYCESRYAGTQPMDVEHWRPKGAILEAGGGKPKMIKPGYYWLAAEWTNLLPSCIDCNRSRTQLDKLEGKNVVLGKKNQFPVKGQRVLAHELDEDGTGGGEQALLLNPCVDDPETFLRYDENGVIHPRSDDLDERERAMKSIRVYALNRAELVAQRRALVLQIDHRIRMIAALAGIRDRIRNKQLPAEAEAISDLIGEEIDALLEMRQPDRPYAGLARQLIREVHRELTATAPGRAARVRAQPG